MSQCGQRRCQALDERRSRQVEGRLGDGGVCLLRPSVAGEDAYRPVGHQTGANPVGAQPVDIYDSRAPSPICERLHRRLQPFRHLQESVIGMAKIIGVHRVTLHRP